MPRSVNSVASRNRRKKILKAAKGYFGRRKNVYTVAKNAVEKGMLYAYRDRKNNKRNFRSLWITRINAAARLNGMSYSQFMGKVKAQNIELNRKVLADLAVNNPGAFKAVVGLRGNRFQRLRDIKSVSVQSNHVSELKEHVRNNICHK
jgi:large subunit ribosomal protein L20